MSSQQISMGDGSNMVGVSYDAEGQNPMPIAYPCEACGASWHRCDEFDSGGARYLIRGRWLCVSCYIGPIEDANRYI